MIDVNRYVSGSFDEKKNMEPDPIELLKQAELLLSQKQNKLANRVKAIALTHLQTAILWLESGKE